MQCVVGNVSMCSWKFGRTIQERRLEMSFLQGNNYSWERDWTWHDVLFDVIAGHLTPRSCCRGWCRVVSLSVVLMLSWKIEGKKAIWRSWSVLRPRDNSLLGREIRSLWDHVLYKSIAGQLLSLSRCRGWCGVSCTSHSYVVLESLQSWLKELCNLTDLVDIVSPVGWIRLELLLESHVSCVVLE